MVARSTKFLLFEARVMIVTAFFLALSLWYAGNLPAAAMTGVFVLLFMFKFRNPVRVVPADPLAVVSPVDGRVEAIERVSHPLHEGDAIQVKIRVAAFGAYVFRAPTEGRLSSMPANPRRWSGIARGLTLTTDEDDRLALIMHGPWFAPPAAAKRIGDRVGQGESCGVVRLATSAEVFLPGNTKLQCIPGEKLLAGESVLGYFVH